MASTTPLWHKVVARVDDVVTPHADALVRSEAFAVAAGLAVRTRRDAGRGLEGVSRRVWHLLNLPAGSDVNRVLGQIASLERQVRLLEKRLSDARSRSAA
jgi:hypothetical protein